eukprot:Gregarina_sp_Poly_1__4408@NODE_237_length_10947_cov_116_066912_g209_i0_p4_GENE_NODE_237_length_10947_cov_116_066912_g209_i0NODE_237_length_10947_cov_116_066912_g209_i0_p4_ORF_typecomplete_len437_score68_49SRP54/PF00448_22/1_4e68AAA_30/PF13604_6/1_3e05AAA_25/PF13481_6/1_4e02AAA_25/PF13481_6/0_0011AAA_24/PF13479_6/0_00017AAA_16/PF13191_6/96AAA_16/PF13191_6/0_00036T2SSE/PF00437_20/0_00048T2SSE/PF00437_20/2_3e03MipZ/PF09140_11/0_00056DAP3/PF10236_9/0_00033AAA_22/PF13401_6/1_4e03AAA_22/PF13401_6/0_00
MELSFLVASTGGIVLWESEPEPSVYKRWSAALVKASAVASDSAKWTDNIQFVQGDGLISAAYRSTDLVSLDGCTVRAVLHHLLQLAAQKNGAEFPPKSGWLQAFVHNYKKQRHEQKQRERKTALNTLPAKKSWAESLREKFSIVKNYDSLPKMIQEVDEKMQARNVANAAAAAISKSVRRQFESARAPPLTHTNLINVFEQVLTEVLRPVTRRNLLDEIARAKNAKRVYSIVVMGVNGVGKSTTLAKLAHFIHQHTGSALMLAACDTFRSGAIEQLRKHAITLGLKLYDHGYGIEPATVACAALARAAEENVDVVLIDTAGRMQDNQPLMQALGKLVARSNPDMLLFVGEALVGNDGLDQLMKFDRALVQGTSTTGSPRTLDGIILTKFDTVDDKIGAAITMSYESRKPILFVGTGQTYDDLRMLEPRDVAATLLS